MAQSSLTITLRAQDLDEVCAVVKAATALPTFLAGGDLAGDDRTWAQRAAWCAARQPGWIAVDAAGLALLFRALARLEAGVQGSNGND